MVVTKFVTKSKTSLTPRVVMFFVVPRLYPITIALTGAQVDHTKENKKIYGLGPNVPSKEKSKIETTFQRCSKCSRTLTQPFPSVFILEMYLCISYIEITIVLFAFYALFASTSLACSISALMRFFLYLV